MSLAIEVDKVMAVLLADGWHRVAWRKKGERGGISTFDIDSYEYINSQPDNEDGSTNYPLVLLAGGNAGICSTGATWKEGTKEEPDVWIYVPLTSILAVRCAQ